VLDLNTAFADSAVALLAQPFIAALLGILAGCLLLLASRSSFRRISPDAAAAGLALAALSLFGRLVLVTAALWAYKHYVVAGLKPFAFALAGSFLVLYTVEVVRYSGLLKRRRPASAGQ
jgi:hypothetical protein